MKAHPVRGVPVQGDRDKAVVTQDELGDSWLTPGRVIRVPVGWLLLAGAGVIILFVGGYMLGYRAGEAATEQKFLGVVNPLGDSALAPGQDPLNERRVERDHSDGPGNEISSPVVMSPTERASYPPAGSKGWEETPGRETPGKETPGNIGSEAPPRTGRMGSLESDPRVAGWSYFVLAETPAEGARRLARFCRGKGLESYVVSSHNTRDRKVIVFPGFRDPVLMSVEVRNLRATINRIGDKWKRQEPGATSLRDAYLHKYGG